MRLFVEIARLGSFSAAATLLGLTQPAVSYQIRRLEEQFGVTLLRRRHRGAELTAEGERLLEVTAKAIGDIDALARSFRVEAQRPVVRLRTDYAFSALWLIPRMDGFRHLHPETDMQIVATQRLAAGFRDEADVAVVFGTRAEFGSVGTLLLPERIVPVCTQGFLDRNGPFDDPGQLAKRGSFISMRRCHHPGSTGAAILPNSRSCATSMPVAAISVSIPIHWSFKPL